MKTMQKNKGLKKRGKGLALGICAAILGIDGAIVRMGPKKKLKARAVWYHDMKAQIVSAADAGSLDQEEESQEGVEDEEG